METVRRAILLGCVILAIGLAKFAVLKPLVTVEPADFAKSQKDESRWTDDGRRLAGLPLDQYINEKTAGVLHPVSGTEWERFFAGVLSVQGGRRGDEALLRRVPVDERDFEYETKVLFYKPAESPLSQVLGGLTKEGQTIILALGGGEGMTYLEARLHVYTSDDFHFGSGFSHTPRPPAEFLFPYRFLSLWLLGLGVALYIILPRKKWPKDTIRYAGWRIVLGDIASLILFIPFFALPFFILGGTVQALSRGWILCLVLWPLAFLGVWLLRRSAWYAGYGLRIGLEGLEVEMGRRGQKVALADIDHYQPLVLKPPRWLIGMSFLAALAGKGSSGMGAAGRALMLAGSAYGGMGLGLKDGSKTYFWMTDAMGNTALKRAEKLVTALEQARIPFRKEPEEIRAITVPIGRGADGKIVREGSQSFVLIMAAIPILVMLILFGLAMFGHRF